MNERIKELAEQAGITTNLDTDYFEKDINKWVDYYSEKFAELIIKECIQRIKRVGILEDIENETDMVVNAIEEHFGVK